MTFADAYLSYWFCQPCPCGHVYSPDGLSEAKEHWERGHYEAKAGRG